jgi:hypothetical protein
MSDTDNGARGALEYDGFDAESRRLCPDDNCTGVIAPDGKCKVCAKEAPDGPPPATGAAPPPKPEAAPAAGASTVAEGQAAAEDQAGEAAVAEGEAAAEPAAEPATELEASEGDFDPDERVLCPDDNCTGLIGPDGKCKVCGKESPGGPPPVKGKSTPGKPQPAPKPAAKKEAQPLPSGKGGAKGFDPNDRILCSDDCCTGLIGPDGKCKVCGKPHVG